MTMAKPSAEVITAWMGQEPEQMHKVSLSHLLEGVSAGESEALKLAIEMFNSRLAFGTAPRRG